jgi:TonB family protein
MLCLPLVALGQEQSSLAHYRRAEVYLQQNNLQTAAKEFQAALNGDLEPAWTVVWSHIRLGQIFDATAQHGRAVDEYQQAEQTGDNTDGALDQANDYLQHGEHAIYLPPARPHLPLRDPIQRTEPEYTEEARLAELEGTVLITASIGGDGFAHDLNVLQPLGLGLDEKAVEAVQQWHFAPNLKPEGVNMPNTQIAVDFRLPEKRSRWHLIQVQFETPAGATRPVFSSALYPIGAGIGPEAMEEGRLLVAIGRLATARLTFNVDQRGMPADLQIANASEPVWGSEATALVGQWRFLPAMKNGVAMTVPCTLDLVWGARELDASRLALIKEVLDQR